MDNKVAMMMIPLRALNLVLPMHMHLQVALQAKNLSFIIDFLNK